MTRARAAIAAAVVAVAMALTGAGIAHTGQTKPTTPLVVTDRPLAAAEVGVSGDGVVLVAGSDFDVTLVPNEERSRGSCC
jgi:hypothetical protein